MQIAVLLNKDGNTTDFGESSEIVVYEYLGDHWDQIKVLSYRVSEEMQMTNLRENLKEIAECMMPCTNLVASKLNGLAYTTFEVMGFQLWEIEGKPDAFLDHVRLMEIDRIENDDKVKEMPLPVPEKLSVEGHYFIDLEKAKQYYTSKQVIIPFLKKGGFSELLIHCSHVPPWFERELSGLGYIFESERTLERQYVVRIKSS